MHNQKRYSRFLQRSENVGSDNAMHEYCDSVSSMGINCSRIQKLVPAHMNPYQGLFFDAYSLGRHV